jgi:hypothetical protein
MNLKAFRTLVRIVELEAPDEISASRGGYGMGSTFNLKKGSTSSHISFIEERIIEDTSGRRPVTKTEPAYFNVCTTTSRRVEIEQ